MKIDKKGRVVVKADVAAEGTYEGREVVFVVDRDLHEIMGRMLVLMGRLEKHLAEASDLETDDNEIVDEISDIVVEFD